MIYYLIYIKLSLHGGGRNECQKTTLNLATQPWLRVPKSDTPALGPAFRLALRLGFFFEDMRVGRLPLMGAESIIVLCAVFHQILVTILTFIKKKMVHYFSNII